MTASLLKSPQVSRTLLSIMTVINNSLVWMVSTRPLTSKSSCPFNNPLVTVPKEPMTTGIILTFMFHSFSILLQVRDTCPAFHILSVLFCGQTGQQSRRFCKYYFLLIITWSGLLAEIWGSVCMSKSHRSLCVLFSWHMLGCAYTLICMVKFLA